MPPSIRASVFAELAPVPHRPLDSGRHAGRRLKRVSRSIGLALVAAVAATAVFGPVFARYDPFSISGGSLESPSRGHPMGTDALGRDMLSAILHGTRTSLLVAGAVSIIALACGIVIGTLAGYHRGWVDDALMRATEIFQVIPRFFFAIITIALFGPGLDRIILTLGLTSWPVLARVVRGEVIAMRDLDFIRAAEAMGGTMWHIVLRQLVPNVLPTVVVALGLLFGQILLLDATLGFLGLGDPSTISWGMMAAQAQGFLREAWWLALFPGMAITITVLGVNLLADSVSAGSAAR